MPRIRLFTACALCLCAGGTMANGLTINEQSASSMGTAFAGRASSAIDASTVFGNPAGMSRLERREVSGGLALIAVDSQIDEARSDVPGISGTVPSRYVPTSAVPFGYLVTPLDERWHFGLGLYAPFALMGDYGRGFVGRYKAQRSEVRVVTLQPVLSYRVNEQLAVGFGPTFNRIDGTLTNALNFAVADAQVDIVGSDTGYGYSLGLLADLSRRLAWGVTYRSKVDYTLEGRTRIGGVPALMPGLDALNGRYRASLDFTSPESLDTSVSWQLDPRWAVHAGTTWTRWSRLQEIVVQNQGVALPGFDRIQENLAWSDTWSWFFGAAHRIDPRWVLRAGVALDPSPTRARDRSARIPVGDRQLFSLGAGWSPQADLSLDLAYLYAREQQAAVRQPAVIQETGAGPLAIQPGYFADYRNRFHVLAAQLSYRF